MRLILLTSLLIISHLANAQGSKFSYSVAYLPGMSFYKDDISFSGRDHAPMKTFSPFGVRGSFYYKLAKGLELSAGIGFADHVFHVQPFFNHAIAANDHTKILMHAQKLSYIMAEFPVYLGYKLFDKSKFNITPKAGIAANCLLFADYNAGKYKHVFWKNYWSGIAVNGGVDIQYRFKKNMCLMAGVEYSFSNSVKDDPFLFSRDENTVAIDHRYLAVLLGVRVDLK